MPDQPRGNKDSERPAAGSSGEVREMLVQLLDGGLLFKLIALIAVFVAVPLAEIFLFVYIGHLVGNFLVLVMAVLASAVGAVLFAGQASRSISRWKPRHSWEKVRGPELVELAGIIAGGILLLTPGFITDLCGFALLLPPARKAAGTLIVKAMGPRLREVFERADLVQRLKIR
jgi:UPF0716 family protein affecting phage T7 exclusion